MGWRARIAYELELWAKRMEPRLEAWFQEDEPKFRAWSERMGQRHRRFLIATAAPRRFARMLHLRAWRPLAPLEVESAERAARAEARWSAARWSPELTAWDWTLRFAKAAGQGLDDPWEARPLPRMGPLEALGLGAAAAWSASWRGWALEKQAAGPAPRHAKFVGSGFGWDWSVERGARRWSRSDRVGGAGCGRAQDRAQWILWIARDGAWIDAMDKRLGAVPALALLCALPVRISLVPALMALRLLAASWRAFRARSEQASILAEMSRRARLTAAEAVDWLEEGDRLEAEDGFDCPVYEWEWAGVKARSGERLESAGWLGCAAAVALPPKERALAAACWFEAMGAVLGGPDAFRMLSSTENTPRELMISMANGSAPSPEGLGPEMLRAGLESPGCASFFQSSLPGWRWTRGAVSGRRGGKVEAIAQLAYGSGAMGKLLARSHPSLAAWLAKRAADRDATDQEMMALGCSLAQNPNVAWSAEEMARLAGIAPQDPGALAYRSRREAIALAESLAAAAAPSEPKVRVRAKRL